MEHNEHLTTEEQKNEAELTKRRNHLEEVLNSIDNDNEVVIKSKQKS
jgi:hypothetical protein